MVINLKTAIHPAVVIVILQSLGASLAQWDYGIPNDFHDDCSAIGNHEWSCGDTNNFPICVPWGYNMKQAPSYPKIQKSKGIFANFVLNSKEGAQKDIKAVDVNKK